MTSVVFTQNGEVVTEDTVKQTIADFAINGYRDVPFNNLMAYVRAFESIECAQWISDNSWKMVKHLRSLGFNWSRRAGAS